MKHITDTGSPQQTVQKNFTKTSRKSPMSQKWIAALFAKLHARYGIKWTQSYPSEELLRLASDEWAKELAGLSADDIKRGLEAYQDPWPPTCPEFKRACSDPHKKNAHQWYEFQKPRDRSEAKAEARTAIEIMREILKDQAPPPDRQDPAYIEWANYHRKVCKMPPIERVKPDGSFVLKGQNNLR